MSRATVHFLLAFCLAALALIASAGPGVAKDSWIEVRSPNFTVLGNVSEGSARQIADHFEQFRELFESAFPKVRVDLGKPLVIFAVKNEDAMKLLLPGYWETKGHVHPAGIYVPGEDKHFVVVRENTEGENPYQIVYHEYTHALMDLNYRGLPLWLGEGVAEFLGNSTLHEKSAEIGNIASYHLEVLQQNRLIPVEELLQINRDSPYYNEANRTSIFYAESWMLVHYLMLDPDARKQQLLQHFLTSWDASGNALDAAQKTFGDLKKFTDAMEKYANQKRFFVGTVNTTLHPDPKSYSLRALSQAEIDAARGELYLHTQRPKEARVALNSAVQLQPNLAEAHQGLGELAFSNNDLETAEKEFTTAAQLNPNDFINYFYQARSLMHHGMATPQQAEQVAADLEKTISLNPNYAAAYSVLASIYSMRPETREKAFVAGRRSIQLEPGNLSYAVNFAYVLLNTGRVADAKVLSQRISATAKSPGEQKMAHHLSELVATREEHDKQIAAYAEAAKHANDPANQPKTGTAAIPSLATATAKNTPPIGSNSTRTGPAQYSLEGKIASIDCAAQSEGTLAVLVNSVLMKFHYADLTKVELRSTAKTANGTAPACKAWKGQKAKVTFEPADKGQYDGELTAIQFF
jgi:Tfp pilus assembly protein PilF